MARLDGDQNRNKAGGRAGAAGLRKAGQRRSSPALPPDFRSVSEHHEQKGISVGNLQIIRFEKPEKVIEILLKRINQRHGTGFEKPD